MSEQIIEQINTFNDFQVIRFFNHFSRKIFSDIKENEEELMSLIPTEIKDSKELSPIFKLTTDDKKNTLDAENAATCARNILFAMAQQSGLEDILAEELKTYKDDELFANMILAVGAATAMILFAATIRGKATYKDGKWNIQVSEEVAPTGLVEKTLNPLAKAAGQLAIKGAADDGGGGIIHV